MIPRILIDSNLVLYNTETRKSHEVDSAIGIFEFKAKLIESFHINDRNWPCSVLYNKIGIKYFYAFHRMWLWQPQNFLCMPLLDD